MAIRGCKVFAIEGAHGSGKTTLVNSVTAALKIRDFHVGTVQEIARRSPFVEEVAVNRLRDYDIHADLHLFSAHIAEEQRAARQYQILLVDRSVVSVLAYAEIFRSAKSEADARIIAAMWSFTKAYVVLYDTMFFVHDVFDTRFTADKFRPADRDLQKRARDEIRRVISHLEISVVDLPSGLDLAARTSVVVESIVATMET
jgi:thymidylate kinase